jgi:CelD/BcsL family acetyltransferase involved in cellulose biosynthesis
MDAVRDEWTALAHQTRNIFASWEWQQTWWNHFGDGRPRMITALRDSSDTLRALLPIYLSAQRPLRIARFFGDKAGDQLGPICAPGDEPAVSRAARSLLRDGKWDVLLGEQMPGTGAWSKRLSGRTVRREGNPVVTFSDSWEATSKAWSKRLRKELRRDERRLREHHDMHVRTVTDPDELESSLDTFFALHRIRWTQGTVFEQREAFHRDFARTAFHNGWLRLRFMDIDGKPAAARLGFRYGDIESGYQSGWLPQYSDYSIGILLVADTIRAAHSDGMREYRFLRGGEDYKYRFASADPGLETAFFARGAASGVVSGGVALADSALIRQLRGAADSDG